MRNTLHLISKIKYNIHMFLDSTYLVHNTQPICGLVLGTILLVFTFLINHGRTKIQATTWLKLKLYKNNERSDYLAAKFIDGISKFSMLFGLSLVLLSVYFLENIK